MNITLPSSQFIALFISALFGHACALWFILRYAWERAQAWAERRVERRYLEYNSFAHKIVRQASTGTIGLCIGIGYGCPGRATPWKRFLKFFIVHPVATILVCPQCVTRYENVSGMAEAIAIYNGAVQSGSVRMIRASEMTLATPQDAEAFRARQNESEHGH